MIEQFPIIDHFAITPRARVTWLADPRHQGTVTTTWPNGTADITWDTGWLFNPRAAHSVAAAGDLTVAEKTQHRQTAKPHV